MRTQVAFYASTPGYRAFLEYHGHLDIAKRLSQLMRNGEIAAMPGLVPDTLLEEVAIFGPHAALPGLLRERYSGGLLQCTALYLPPAEGDPMLRGASLYTNSEPRPEDHECACCPRAEENLGGRSSRPCLQFPGTARALRPESAKCAQAPLRLLRG